VITKKGLRGAPTTTGNFTCDHWEELRGPLSAAGLDEKSGHPGRRAAAAPGNPGL